LCKRPIIRLVAGRDGLIIRGMDRRLTTVVAADLVGYARLMAADEEGTITRLRAARAEVIDPAIAEAGGRIVKVMGDGLLMEFPSPVAATRCALAVQKAMAERETGPEDMRLRFRVGVHLGDVVIDDEDLLGDGVNVAARLESLAPPGGICISRTVHDQIRGKVEAPLTALGPQMVKNIPDPVEVWRVELGGVVAPIASPAAKAERPSIAVLPFDNMSRDPDQEFLADGIVEDVITELSRFRQLLVIARNSTFAYKGARKDVREIAKELGVRYVVEGSVRRAGERIRVSAQLIEAATGAHLWAERWDRTLADLFDLQDELTRAIVTGVEPELGAHERALARRKPTKSLTAWELCQKGYSEFVTYSDAGFMAAYDLYHEAERADPNFALVQALLARWYWIWIGSGRAVEPETELRRGLAHAKRAIELDDRLDAGYFALGVLLAMSGREKDAENALETATALNSNHAVLFHARAMATLFRAEPDADAIEENARTALRVNPKDPLAWAFHFMIGHAGLIRGLDATDPNIREAYQSACRFANADYFPFLASAICNAADGRRDAAHRYLGEALARRPELTRAMWARAFRFPVWSRMVEAFGPGLDVLVTLGLPRE